MFDEEVLNELDHGMVLRRCYPFWGYQGQMSHMSATTRGVLSKIQKL